VAVKRNTEHLPIQVGKTIWSNLALLLAIDAVLFVVAIPMVALFFGGGSLLAALAGALTLGPFWAGTVASTDRMIRDEVVSLRVFVKNVRCYAGRGVMVSLVPAIVVTTILGTLAILEARPDEWWLFVPLFVDGSVLTLLFLATFSVFSLATTGRLKGWALWRASLEVVVANPMIALGTMALLVLLWFLVSLLPGLLPVLPAPLAVYLSAAAWSTISRREDETINTRGPE
jgi:uncharacterized membrane protein YesL